jgi:ketosteroid isomerase-like protein
MPFEGALADRILIRERMSDYADAMFQRDLDAWLANFTEDCLWRGNGMEMRGLEALAASWPNLWAPLNRMAYFTEVAAIKVTGDTATARCYSRQIMFQKDGAVRKFAGLYHDKLVRSGETWLFAERAFEFIGTEPNIEPAA